MTKHRTPAAGYVSDAKQDYREKVWAAFKASGAIHRAVTDNQFILILPGLQCDEIETAIRYGCPPDRIICVHESAAHVATSAEWRKRWPDMPFYCCKVSEVGAKLKRDRRVLCAANLDFCNNFSMELLGEFRGLILGPSICDHVVVSVNLRKGRESPAVVEMLINGATRMKHATVEKRIAMLIDMAIPEQFSTKVISEGGYVSSSPMHFATIAISSTTKGVQVRRGKSGATSYRVEVMVDGRRKSKSFASAQVASAFASTVRDNIDAVTITVADAIRDAERLATYDAKNSCSKFMFWERKLGDRLVFELSASDVQKALCDLMLDGKSAATADRYKSALSVCLVNTARKLGVTLNNPCRHVHPARVMVLP